MDFNKPITGFQAFLMCAITFQMMWASQIKKMVPMLLWIIFTVGPLAYILWKS